MAVTAQVFRHGGYPANWAVWGQARVSPGQTTVIGSGGGPFFNVTGVQDGAIFVRNPSLNIILKVNGVSTQVFNLYDGTNAGEYRALVFR